MKKKESIDSLADQLFEMVEAKMSLQNCKDFVSLCFTASESTEDRELFSKMFASVAEEYSKAPPVCAYKSEQKILQEKLNQDVSQEEVQVHSVMNFYFANENLSKAMLLQEVYPDAVKRNHRKRLLKGCDLDLTRFFARVSEKERGAIIRYIMNNYKGVSLESIKEYYL